MIQAVLSALLPAQPGIPTDAPLRAGEGTPAPAFADLLTLGTPGTGQGGTPGKTLPAGDAAPAAGLPGARMAAPAPDAKAISPIAPAEQAAPGTEQASALIAVFDAVDRVAPPVTATLPTASIEAAATVSPISPPITQPGVATGVPRDPATQREDMMVSTSFTQRPGRAPALDGLATPHRGGASTRAEAILPGLPQIPAPRGETRAIEPVPADSDDADDVVGILDSIAGVAPLVPPQVLPPAGTVAVQPIRIDATPLPSGAGSAPAVTVPTPASADPAAAPAQVADVTPTPSAPAATPGGDMVRAITDILSNKAAPVQPTAPVQRGGDAKAAEATPAPAAIAAKPVEVSAPLPGPVVPRAQPGPAPRLVTGRVLRERVLDPIPTAPAAAAPAPVISAAAPEALPEAVPEAVPAAIIAHIEALRDAVDAVDTSIRIVPDALGPIDVSVRRDGDVTHVQLTAEQTHTARLLAEAQPRLTEQAEARGLKLSTSTGHQPGTGNAGAGTDGQPHQQARASAEPPLKPRRAVAAEAETPTDQRIA